MQIDEIAKSTFKFVDEGGEYNMDYFKKKSLHYRANLDKKKTYLITAKNQRSFYELIFALDGYVDGLIIADTVGLEGEELTEIKDVKSTGASLKVLGAEKISIEPIEKLKQTKWFLSTSGTTGKPKLIEHKLEFLMASITDKPMVGLNLSFTFDFTKFAGLQVFFQALRSGSTLISNSSVDRDLTDFWVKNNLAHLSSTNTQMLKLLMNKNVKNLNLSSISLGGEIVTSKCLKQASRLWPNARITHIFASTESGILLNVKDAKAGFQIAHLKNGAFVDEGCLKYKDKDGQISTTHDLVEFSEEDQRYYFIGREDDIVVVAGVNVALVQVENIVYKNDTVIDVRVWPKSSSMIGNILMAEIVFQKNVDEKSQIKEINSTIRNHIGKHAIPARYEVVNEISLTRAGKKDRRSE